MYLRVCASIPKGYEEWLERFWQGGWWFPVAETVIQQPWCDDRDLTVAVSIGCAFSCVFIVQSCMMSTGFHRSPTDEIQSSLDIGFDQTWLVSDMLPHASSSTTYGEGSFSTLGVPSFMMYAAAISCSGMYIDSVDHIIPSTSVVYFFHLIKVKQFCIASLWFVDTACNSCSLWPTFLTTLESLCAWMKFNRNVAVTAICMFTWK